MGQEIWYFTSEGVVRW